MHYQDGTEVQLGDIARTVAKPDATYSQTEQLGIVVAANPNSAGCNLHVNVFAVRDVSPMGVSPWRSALGGFALSVTASDSLLVLRHQERQANG